MQTLLYYASYLALAAVAVVLLMGLWALKQGKSPNLSQQLMRWRVALQFTAIVILVAYAVVSHM